ncbi:AAA ATPase central domain-containing protein [Calothrix sp. NIES-2100]|uniref:AAA family ATPase n=1 Tax=Calothrix sp. NIES-2100 TaxID=1954172 RepID=UPI000B5FF994|nr:AAA ATPase central domain-containing protein [Calothrix sp. NIES-2100]
MNSYHNSQQEYDHVPADQLYEKCLLELRDLLRSRYPLVFLRSSEENRAVRCAMRSHDQCIDDIKIKSGDLCRWDSKIGFQKRLLPKQGSEETQWQQLANPPSENTNPVIQALDILQRQLQDFVIKYPDRQFTYILPDWSALIGSDDRLIARRLKELLLDIEDRIPRPRMTLIVIGADWSIPPIVRNQVHILDLALPTGKELYDNIFSVASEKYELLETEAKRLAELAQGIPLQAAIQAAMLVTTRKLWTQPEATGKLLLEVKKQEIRKTGVLEYYTPQGEGLKSVGGLENIKAWIESRKVWFEQDLEPQMRPRAILLEGFPGCGKTFIARAIAQEWCVPQINFEISRLQSKFVGESESNTFHALRAIEASAPNILFMDEIEKAFSGTGTDTSGVSTRQFGTFLSWLNDHQYPIFFIATSNDREKLPPELFRAGRFDEIFIVMPPNTQERGEIIQKCIQNHNLSAIDNYTLEELVNQTVGFTGAELDKLVKESKYLAGFQGTLTDSNWSQALAKINPQYRTGKMQTLLQKYLKVLSDGSGMAASIGEPGFLNQLIL